MSYKKFQVYFFLIFLALSLALTLMVFWPYLTLLAFGGVLAIISRPIYHRLYRILKSDTASAFLTIILIATAVLLPLAFFIASLSTELLGLFSNIKGHIDSETLSRLLRTVLPPTMHAQIPAMLDEGMRIVQSIAEALSKNLFKFFSNLVNVFVGLVVVVISAYYLLKDGARVKTSLKALSPLGDEHDELVFTRIITAVSAVMNGILIVSILKGMLTGIFFWIFGVPAPLFWGTMTGFAAFIPIFGSAIVLVPAIAYLFFAGHLSAAIGLTVVAGAVIGTVDNFLQPKLVQSKTNIHPLLVLLSILGGFEFYGFSGFILGPLTLAVLMALVDIYKKEFRHYLEHAE